MQQMKAFVRTSAQDMHVEQAQVPVPELADDEVLVRVRAFGVGIHDRYYIPQDASFPYVIGIEGAGSVAAIGGKVTRFFSGDRVILSSIMQAKGGCWAEYVAVSEASLVPLPPNLDYTAGAALPVAGKTALECVRQLGLLAGDTLFVAGASGAVGTLVIQLASSRGIRVIGSASRANHEFMLSLGAEAVVDYADPDWKQQVRQWSESGVSGALAIQPATTADSMDVVRDGGMVITVSGDQVESERGITVSQLQHEEDARQVVADLASAVAKGGIRLVLEQVYPFDQALAALQKTETRHARGKVSRHNINTSPTMPPTKPNASAHCARVGSLAS